MLGRRFQSRSLVWSTLTALAAAVLAIGGLVAIGYSLGEIRKIRQLERNPTVPIASVFAGEVVVRGTVVADRDVVRAPHSGVTSVYYRARLERRRDNRWRTVSRHADAVDFHLEDETGTVLVVGSEAGIEFDAPRKLRRRRGDRRDTEWRIEPGDRVFVFGFAERVGQDYRIGFRAPGSYYPLVSSRSEGEQRQGRTISSGVALLAGVGMLLFAVFFMLRLLRVHHSAGYLSAAVSVVVVVLLLQGLLMMGSDLRSAHQAAERTLEEGRQAIRELLAERGVAWPGAFERLGSWDEPQYAVLSAADRQRLAGIRQMMALSIERTNRNLGRFPELVVGRLVGARLIPPVELTEAERQQMQAIEQRHPPVRLPVWIGMPALLLGTAGAGLATWLGIGKIALKRMIENVPTSPASGVVYGLTELQGQVERYQDGCELTAPYSRRACLYFRHKIEERQGSGKDAHWETLSDDSARLPFFCVDSTGRMLVDSSQADLFLRPQVAREGRLRHTEWLICPGERIYILGPALINPALHNRLMIAYEDAQTPYLISSSSEDELVHRKASLGFCCLNFGILATLAAALGLAGLLVAFGPLLYVLMAALSCSYLFLVLGLLYYNDLVFLRERVRRNQANIEVALQKRFDLIRNLTTVVQRFLGHERGLQQQLTVLRRKLRSSEQPILDPANVSRINRLETRVLARVESQPRLKSQKLVARLMRALTEVEDEIALMRSGYNDSVARYHRRIEHVPEVLIARLLDFSHASYLPDGGPRT